MGSTAGDGEATAALDAGRCLNSRLRCFLGEVDFTGALRTLCRWVRSWERSSVVAEVQTNIVRRNNAVVRLLDPHNLKSRLRRGFTECLDCLVMQFFVL